MANEEVEIWKGGSLVKKRGEEKTGLFKNKI